MKKKLFLTLMIVTLLMLTSCTTNNEAESDESDLATEANNLENEVAETVEVVEDETSEERNKKTKLGDRIETNDSAVFEVESAYYNEDGSMIVEGYIVNVTDHIANNLRLKKLEIYNEKNELIASNSFGYLEEHGGAVEAGEKFKTTFWFPSVMVTIKDDDLDSINSVSKFTSYHWVES